MDVVPELTVPVPEQDEPTPPRVVVYRVVSADRPFRRVEILGTQMGEAHSLADVEELIRRSGITDVDLRDARHVNWVEDGPEVWTA